MTSCDHDYWPSPTGALICACGQSLRPLPEPDTKDNK